VVGDEVGTLVTNVGVVVGDEVGTLVTNVGVFDGVFVGEVVGFCEGAKLDVVGAFVGTLVGTTDALVGVAEGFDEGVVDGLFVGDCEGSYWHTKAVGRPKPGEHSLSCHTWFGWSALAITQVLPQSSGLAIRQNVAFGVYVSLFCQTQLIISVATVHGSNLRKPIQYLSVIEASYIFFYIKTRFRVDFIWYFLILRIFLPHCITQ